MTRAILIAGNESTLLSAAAAEAAKRVEAFALAVIPNRFPMPEAVMSAASGTAAGTEKSREKAHRLSWNPASPISARSLVLAAENRMGKIDDVILVCSPPAVFKTVEALTPEEIETLVNDHIKGWFFLTRELALYFRRLGSGSLSLVVPEPSGGSKNTQVDILGLSAAASFKTFAQGVIALSAQEPYQAMGFTGYEAGAENEFASWLFKTIDEGEKKNSGRWHKYAKYGFFR
jgi:NAD(P)-dependent dehydrogenase (short-subunit alcohol dehydrogenase family)